MRKYPEESWRRLGEWVHDARMQAGLSDIKEWSKAARRSERMLYGLERGESVGIGTLEAISEALGVARWYLLGILAGTVTDGPLTQEQVDQLRQAYAGQTGRSPDHPQEEHYVFLADATTDELLAELRRRLDDSRTEHGDDDTAPTTPPVTDLGDRRGRKPMPDARQAAARRGTPDNRPDTTTGEESQDPGPGGFDPA